MNIDYFTTSLNRNKTPAASALAPLYSDREGCRLCPRLCGVRREDLPGFCGCPASIRAARAALHPWEEPCISGVHGSGTVFFTGCTLRCRFCQNYQISSTPAGKSLTVPDLAAIFLDLQRQGAHNINLVTATQYLPWILAALDLVRGRLTIPVVYNCGGYERVETVRVLRDYVDIWLPDLKYFDPALSREFSRADDYFAVASAAIRQMVAQTGRPLLQTYTENIESAGNDASVNNAGTFKNDDPVNNAGATKNDHPVSSAGASEDVHLMVRGVIIRHLVLPGHRDDSIRLLRWLASELPPHSFYLSLMSQYTPYRTDPAFPELNRRVTTYEYQKVVDAALNLGLDLGFMQKKSSAREEYTPPFDLEGLTPQAATTAANTANEKDTN